MDQVEYEIIPAEMLPPMSDGRQRVNPVIRIGAEFYPTKVSGGSPTDGLRWLYASPETQAYLRAMAELGIPARVNWQGVANANGDVCQISPPKPLPLELGCDGLLMDTTVV